MDIPEKKLKREIGFAGLSANIINTVIGAGIFALPAIIAADLGPASILAYVFCGVLITLMMLCFAEVGSKITETGGVYIYIQKTFGKFPGFLTAVFLLLSTITADAAIANAIIEIIFKIIPNLKSEIIRILFFVFLFAGFAYINITGLKKGVGFVKIITLVKIAPLMLIVLMGFKNLDLSNLIIESTPSIKQIGETSLILFFAFTGAGSALSVSGEVRDPQKNIPRAILFGVFVVGVIYVMVQTVAQGVLGSSLPLFTENPLGEVASKIFGPIGFTLLTIGAAVSMFGGMSSRILSVPRVLFAASENEVIPFKLLSRVHPKYMTPAISIIVYVSLGFILAVSGGFKQLVIVSTAASLFISLGISVATIKLRRNDNFKAAPNTFKIPGGYLIPILSSLVIIWFLSNLSQEKIIGFVLFTLVLTVFYFLMNLKVFKRKKN